MRRSDMIDNPTPTLGPTLRRQSPKWLDGDCPRGVLAIYDNGGIGKRNGSVDRYTVFYADVWQDIAAEWWVGYLSSGADPSGCSGHEEMQAHQVAAYRYRVRHQATRWTDLPEAVRAIVVTHLM
jgi:hypothetical protein